MILAKPFDFVMAILIAVSLAKNEIFLPKNANIQVIFNAFIHKILKILIICEKLFD